MKPIIAICIIIALAACTKVPEGKRSLNVEFKGDSLKYESDTRKPDKEDKDGKSE